MNAQRLEEIKQRVAKAENGYWLAEKEKWPGNDNLKHWVVSSGLFGDGLAAYVNYEDAEFSAHARQDVPDLIAEVERLKGILSVCYDEYADLDSQYKKTQKRLKEVENLFRITDDVLRKEYNKNENLREALAFYADNTNYSIVYNKNLLGSIAVDKDRGEIARQALQEGNNV